MSSVVISGDTSGTITLQAPTVSGTTVLTLPATSGTVLTTASGTAATATNLAGGSNGTIPYQSASGTTQMLAVGTPNQVLQTNGAGAPTWVTPSAGAWVYLSTVTASNSATVDIETTFNSTYQNYVIIGSSIKPVDSVVNLYARQKQSGTYVTSNYQYHFTRSNNTSTTYAASATGAGSEYLVATDLSAPGDGSQGGVSFVMHIPNPSNTTLQKGVFSIGIAHSAYLDVGQITLAGANTLSTVAVTGIRFLMQSGNISTGTFRLYGIANS